MTLLGPIEPAEKDGASANRVRDDRAIREFEIQRRQNQPLIDSVINGQRHQLPVGKPHCHPSLRSAHRRSGAHAIIAVFDAELHEALGRLELMPRMSRASR
jgi:hypothetical protein